ncbi:hypothetical protein HMPREF9120_01320 [Neisseria sp. oral taxon 020 str. F0370]|nr:hypothetical protein HMPREF9120_01320 [Neisseria sp. oral taxon 020 str. F0370]
MLSENGPILAVGFGRTWVILMVRRYSDASMMVLGERCSVMAGVRKRMQQMVTVLLLQDLPVSM